MVTERDAHTHLLYLERLFHVDHVAQQLAKEEQFGNKTQIIDSLHRHDRDAFAELHAYVKQYVDFSAYTWIEPNFWKNKRFDCGISSVKQ